MRFKKLPVEIEAFTFDEFVKIGLSLSVSTVNGVPWSFTYNGYPVMHEDNDHYLIGTLEGKMDFTRKDMLIVGVNGEIYPCKIDIFNKTYEKA